MMTHQSSYGKKMVPPAVTIYPISYDGNGWKNSSHTIPPTSDFFLDYCNGYNNTVQDALDCIEKEAYGDKDIIQEPTSGWTSDVSNIGIGKTFTLNNSYQMGTSQIQGFSVLLAYDPSYFAVIHDPRFYSFSDNTRTTPKIELTIDNSTGFRGIFIEATRVIKMNRTEHPCQESLTYSFTKCVKNFAASNVGCMIMVDDGKDNVLPVCTDLDQLKQYQHQYEEISDITQHDLVKRTACLPPCTYMDYKIVGRPMNYNDDGLGFYMAFASDELIEEKEEEIYGVVSFVAEFGGALGLFLGFSFLTVQEWIEQLSLAAWRKLNGKTSC